MRINEFNITKYGPLSNKEPLKLGDFNLLFGRNEQGKSLTIDALIKLLFNKGIKRDFENIDRVDESPVGYAMLSTEKGEMKIPEKSNLEKATGLTTDECNNIFIVRNSQLSISKEGEFYTNITDKLTGLRTQEISGVKESLRDIAKITPRGSFRDSKEGKIKEKIRKAREIIDHIDEMLTRAKEGNMDELEEREIKKKEKLEEIKENLQLLEKARKKEKYIKGKKALEKLKEKEESSEAQKLKEKKEKLKKMKEKERKVRKSVAGRLEDYQEKAEAEMGRENLSLFFTYVAVISSVLLGVSIAGILFLSSLVFKILTGAFFLLSLIFWGIKYRFIRKRGNLAKEFQDIKLKASEMGVEGNTIGKIKKNIQDLEEEIEDLEEKTSELKQQQSQTMGTQRGILESYFGFAKEKEDIPFWEEKISELESYENITVGVEYDEDKENKFKEEAKKIEEEIENIKEQEETFQKKMEKIKEEISEILPQEGFSINTSIDLKSAKNKLEEFIGEWERLRENVLEAISIFETIEKEEQGKVSGLFGGDSLVSKYFSKITGGAYSEVFFDQEEEKIEVKKATGEVLAPNQLSGGAYDQLYLSIRLALGEKLLENEKGFFIMDDPFIKADKERVKNQMEILKDISFEMGWQIIYFSAKDEVKDILKSDIDKGKVNLIEFES